MRRRLLALIAAVPLVAVPAGAALALDRTGGDGRDRLIGTRDADRLYGRGGNDLLVGRAGDDLLAGDNGRDRVRGGGGNDTLLGGGGRDRIGGGGGSDQVFGGAGPDVINVRDRFADRVSCGPGRDVVRADASDQVEGDCENVRR